MGSATKIYRGIVGDNGLRRVVVVEGGMERELDPRLDLRNHSPTGFEWGYGGSGPSQLALAILADALNDDKRAHDTYQTFKFGTIALLKQNEGWEMTRDDVLAKVVNIENATPT